MAFRKAFALPVLALAVALVACGTGPEDQGRFGAGGTGGTDYPATVLDLEPSALANEGTEPETEEYLHLVTPDLAVCPTGSSFDAAGGFCVAGGQALGPFPAGMVAECQKLGGTACGTNKWDLDLARRARGDGFCPVGTDIDVTTGICTDDRYAYGPFDLTLIKDCRLAGGGTQCEELRWAKALAPALPPEGTVVTEGGTAFRAVPAKLNEACGSNSKLFNYYKSQNGFMNVRRSARAKLRAIGAGTSARPDRNGCATYLSYALKQSGAVPNMPIEPGTEEFRDALLKRGWKVIKDPSQFQPGDVIVSRDRKGVPGHPDHVYMYAGSKDGAPGMGYVIDNQGTLVHERNISASGNKTRAAYALRAPDAKSGTSCTDDTPLDLRDSCVGKSDGWYCSDIKDFSGFQCKAGAIALGHQCATGKTCSRVNPSADDDRAQMDGQVPACGTQTAPPSSGPSCTSDGQCNPGSNGSGKMCAAGKCVSGCRANWQCPGSTVCRSGQCM